jgi:hypothetical protein
VASYYVDSNAAGAGTGANWANAFVTLNGAFSGKVAGDIFYVAHDHAQTQASNLTLTSPGTALSPCYIYCVNKAGSVPPVSADLRTTATITTTGSFDITFAGTAYYHGIIFNSGTGATIAGFTLPGATHVFNSCSLRKNGTSGTAAALSFNSAGSVDLINTTIHFGAASDGIGFAGNNRWLATASALGGTVSTSGAIAAGNTGTTLIEGVDLSGSGSNILVRAFTAGARNVILKDCKLGTGATISTPTAAMRSNVSLIRCDSADTNYRTEKYEYTGTLTTETTIVRTGGASDGTTPIAWKVITTANSERIYPFEAFPISIWNETTGSSVTVTVECRGAATPNIDEVWMDVEYLGTSGFPQGNFATSGHADLLATGTACTSSSESWGGSTSSFKLVKAITPQEKGPITVYVKIAKVSSTFYIDPMITLT